MFAFIVNCAHEIGYRCTTQFSDPYETFPEFLFERNACLMILDDNRTFLDS